MKNFIGRSQGFTLVEVIVAMAAEGVLLAIMSLILLNMKMSMMRGKEDLQLCSNYRVAKTMIQRELGKADGVTIINSTTTMNYTYLPALGGNNKNISLNAGDDTLEITDITAGQTIVILTDVDSVSFTADQWIGVRLITIQIQLVKTYGPVDGAYDVRYSDEFTVCVRNIALP